MLIKKKTLLLLPEFTHFMLFARHVRSLCPGFLLKHNVFIYKTNFTTCHHAFDSCCIEVMYVVLMISNKHFAYNL